MRIAHIAAVVTIATVGQAWSQPLLPFKSREIQEGKNFIQKIIATPDVSEPTGALTESFAFDIPKGRGVTPQIALEYSSSAAGSEYGWGWELTVPVIERSRRLGVPSNTRDLYRLRVGHSTRELVPTGATTTNGGVEYKERVERTFSRYLRYGNRWTMLTSNGLRYEFGNTLSNRAGTNTALLAGTFTWYVDRIVDSNGNLAKYQYAPDAVTNPRISSISYNANENASGIATFTLDFSWHFRSNANLQESYSSGYRRVFGRDFLQQVTVRASSHVTTGPAQVPSNSPQSRYYQLVAHPAFRWADG